MTKGVFVGLSTIDVVYGIEEFPRPNSKLVARRQDVFVGGPATNAAVTFRHLGGEPVLATALGRHPIASIVRQDLGEFSVGLIDLSPDSHDAPAISSIYVNTVGDRNVVSINASRLKSLSCDVGDTLLGTISVLLVDGHYMRACQAWAEGASARSIHVVLDGGSWKAGTRELLPYVDTAICSADFLPPGCTTEEDVLAFVRDCGVANVAITKGPEPVRFIAGATAGTMAVPHVHVVDTMGAGDILHGALCYYIASGLGFIQALERAIDVASLSTSFVGPREWMNRSGGA